jgi:serralysin
VGASQRVTVDLRIAGPQQTGDGVDVLGGVEGISGSRFADTLTGDDGPNLLVDSGGDDVIYGLGGDDEISDTGFWYGRPQGETTADYLRGGDGNDTIRGGEDGDDINGNQGNDIVLGDSGDDLVRGGQDQDSLNGNAGADTVYGDLGDDTVRGGQGDDSLSGGDGNDWLHGDRGDDTMRGGAGADVFQISWEGSGHDRLLDFNPAEGDRIKMDADNFVVRQVGADTVCYISGGAELVLVGVSAVNWESWVFQ